MPVAAAQLRKIFKGKIMTAGGFNGESAEAILQLFHANTWISPRRHNHQARFPVGSHKVSYAKFLGMLQIGAPNEADMRRYFWFLSSA